MKKILHVFGVMNRGGAELRTFELQRGISRQLAEFHYCVLSGRPGSLDEDIRKSGGRVHYVPLGPDFPRRFRRLLRVESFDIVHSHVHHVSGLIVRLASDMVAQRIVHFRNTTDGGRDSLIRKIRNMILKHWVDKYATDILAVSVGTMEAAWRPDWFKDPRCRVVYNGIAIPEFDVQKEDVPAIRREFGVSSDSVVLIHVGRFAPQKNHPRVVRIFAELQKRLPESHLVLVGDGDRTIKERLQSLTRELGIVDRVIFAGIRTDVPRLVGAADVMVFPSLWEGLPGAVLESLAVGTPVIAASLPGTEEIKRWLAGITTVSLHESDEVWSEHIIEALSLARSSEWRKQIAREFRSSCFSFDYSLAQFRSVWGIL